MDRGERRTDLRRVQPRIRGEQVDPLVQPDLGATDAGEDATVSGTPHLRCRHPGGARSLLELGARPYLIFRLRLEGNLDSP